MARKYLYGAAVQGIQSFIFATNELKDIVGASELVAKICGEFFDEFRGSQKSDPLCYERGQSIVKAAGNIKFLFDNEADCRKAVREFPKKVLTAAPGVTVSQSVVAVDMGDDIGKNIDTLEAKLRACRNRQPMSTVRGLMAMERSRQSGLPVVKHSGGDVFDAAKQAKWEYLDPANRSLSEKNFGRKVRCTNISRFTKGGNSWIAVIHIDGNGLGQIVSKIGKDANEFGKFSIKLDEACVAAAQKAADKVINDFMLEKRDDRLPIRPIVLSGDDHTLICRADLALPYVEAFLRGFESETREKIGPAILGKAGLKCLTACAGIAFIKDSYPFYYGYDLAESLCERAKKDAKKEDFMNKNGNAAPSCLMFHKVQDSFVASFSEIVERELSPCPNLSFEAGPYYLDENFANGNGRLSIAQLRADCDWLDGKGDGAPEPKEACAVKNSLRKWLSALHKDKEMADQMLVRMKDIRTTASNEREFIANLSDNDRPRNIRAYDILSLHSVVYGD